MHVRQLGWFVTLSLLLFSLFGCDKLSNIGTSVAGNIYNRGTPQGGHITLVDFNTGSTAYQGQSQDGHFIIQDVKAGEYVIRYMNMNAIPMGGGRYIKVLPGRPVTEIKFEIWEVVGPDTKDKEGNLLMTKEQFMEKFGLTDQVPTG